MAFWFNKNQVGAPGSTPVTGTGTDPDGSVRPTTVNNSTGTLTYDDQNAWGNYDESVFAVGSSTSGANYLSWGTTSALSFATTFRVSSLFYFTAYPVSGRIIGIYDSTGAAKCSLNMGATGTLTLFDSASTGRGSIGATVPLNQWVRIDLWISANTATATANIFGGALYNNPLSATPTASANNSAGTTLTTATAVLRVGAVTQIANQVPIRFQYQQFSNTATAPPVPIEAAVVSAEMWERFNVGPDGASLTTADVPTDGSLPFTSVVIGSGGTLQYSKERVRPGSVYSLKVGSAGTAAYAAVSNWANVTDIYGRCYVWLDSIPPGAFRIWDTIGIGNVTINSTGRVENQLPGGTPVQNSGVAIPTGKWVRVEWRHHYAGGGAATCDMRIWHTDPESTGTPDMQPTTVTGVSAPGPGTSQRFGMPAGLASFGAYVSDYRLKTTGWVGPEVAYAPISVPFIGWGVPL